ncbi:MAG: hypothetical protein H7Y15_05210 [Pseudonocardia sp.]|nr:hypothetical protein [Pseudonocardia sp.]
MTLALAPTPALFPALSPPPERTLLDVLAETALRHPDAVALDAGGQVLTYRTLADAVNFAGLVK